MVQKEQADAARAQTMLQFFDWAFREGAGTAEGLDYVPIPSSVYELIQSTWSENLMSGGSPVWPL